MNGPFVVLFRRIGPYHHARLDAAAALGPISAIELEPGDATYAWEEVSAPGSYVRQGLPPSTGRAMSFRNLSRLLDSLSPGAVSICGYSDPLALHALAWCEHNKVPAILMSDSAYEDAPRTWAGERVKSFIVKRFRAAFVAGTRHRAYATQLGMPEPAVVLGYDVVDNNYFAASSEVLRAAATPRDAAPYVLACCRFVPKKNVFTLVEAFRRFKEDARFHDWKLVLVGDGPLRSQVEAAVRECGLAADVELAGFVQYREMPRYYAFARFFVHASTIDQWGLVVNEAMASSLPVIVSRQSGCAPDLVVDGSNGYVFDAHDAGELTQRMKDLAVLGVQGLRDMGQRGYERIHAYSCESFARALWRAKEIAVRTPAAPAAALATPALRFLARFIHARMN